ncbi:bifunctional diaminohydroxyphosphoribosylaminopyrimidine deaminase/5-amino-6-(5-phosphoribosylamino)uracil reductase RibD [Croceicoccus sp. F390]|uniref:Riboflavin biosynthesis protein RibD n=1 Tax=Croceicoccus esteveae TaxID=3075597 RepID=A0ABU2ZEW8_9SPHN|nr:bifunctional diaminohydroxyphosphoribosylaminopyrimidine deaminase/5-amino-6-(5-phosphoribosylamino)uracil reductase RibD [Croceicoccus sp. F390]MDT0575143.1 bifunctional diaminohydroxyphosphoribosylaminopyrimidine deaminase/5-amino-6-(5-phosphoribosylamino)uracil reductase RibD [Croceicoccus sp. F390]
MINSQHPAPMPNDYIRTDDTWLAAAARLARRARPLSRPNPAVGCMIVRQDRVVGRGWTQVGGRPHAEAVALAQAGSAAGYATVYVTLEPCAHENGRGPSCTELLIKAQVARVVIGCCDPDPRTAGRGIAALRTAGMEVEVLHCAASRQSLAGYLSRVERQRPFVTLKLALSIDGCLAMADRSSRWITGEAARAHTHGERARHDAILIGRGTLLADQPTLDVRLLGLERQSPERWLLTRGQAPAGWQALHDPADLSVMLPAQYLMVEGGAATAAAFLRADVVDRLLIYRAPIIIGGGMPGIGDIGLGSLAAAHGCWRMTDRQALGSDHLEVYGRMSCLPA